MYKKLSNSQGNRNRDKKKRHTLCPVNVLPIQRIKNISFFSRKMHYSYNTCTYYSKKKSCKIKTYLKGFVRL